MCSDQLIGGNEKILFIDDEESLLTMLTKLISRLGYQLITATDGLEALNLFYSNQKEIDLVIIDKNLPTISGIELIQKIKEIKPEIKIILTSGIQLDSEIDELKAHLIDQFIQKPYTVDILAQTIREVLDKK